jgi:photosystem II stability/assembly factor-like uncharacterized protein
MKTLKYTVIILFILTLNVFSYPPGWEKVDVRPWKPSSSYFTIRCADSANCIIEAEFDGAGGYYFRRTSDAGKTWDNVYKDSAWINWNNGTQKFVPKIRGTAYPNEKLFIAVGDSGLLVRTTDKGETWDNFRLDSNVRLFWLHMLDENIGIVFRREYFGNKALNMLKTTDGGKTWNETDFIEDGLISFWDIDIISRNQIAAIVWKRDSLGATTGRKKLLMAYDNWEYCDTLDMPQYCMDLDFVNEMQGWIAGGYYDSNNPDYVSKEIHYTSDGGKTWVEQMNEEDYWGPISDICFYDEKFGIADAYGALVYITTNGGYNWQEMQLVDRDLSKGTIYPIYDISVASESTAYVILQGDTVFKYTRNLTSVDEANELYDDNNFQCNVYINNTNSNDEFQINLECKLKGEVSLTLYDLLGNLVFEERVNKNSNILSIPIKQDIISGTYFIRIDIDDKFLYNDRIVIVK